MTAHTSRAPRAGAAPGAPTTPVPLIAAFESTYLPGADLDGLEVTGHARRWAADLAEVAGAGVRHLRYPLRWHRIERRPGVYSWAETDAVMQEMVELGLTPIVDLLHHTSYPAWLTDGFVDPRFGEAYVRFCAAVAERYPWISAYTLVNEPFCTTFLAGHEAVWPPYGRGLDGFVRVVRGVLPPLVEAAAHYRTALPDAVHVWVDSGEHHVGTGCGARHALVANDRRHVILDLFLGQDLDLDRPFLRQFVEAGGGDLLDLPPQRIDVLGLDYYPHSEWFYDDRAAVAPSPQPVGLAAILATYGERYGAPLVVTETNIRGLPPDRVTWLRHVLDQCRQASEAGYAVHGLCWFPHLDSHDWDSLLALCRGRPDPVGVVRWTEEDRDAPSVFRTAWHEVAAGATADDLPAYRFQPPNDTQLAGFAALMEGWPWQDPPPEETPPARPVRTAYPQDLADRGGPVDQRNSRDLVVVSHLRWTWVWQRPQHLVSRLGRQRTGLGRRTWFVEEPVPADVPEPVLRTEPHGDVTRVWLEVPHPDPAGRGGRLRFADRLGFEDPRAESYGRLLRTLLHDHGQASPDVWMYTPMATDLLDDLLPYRLVYDVMDDLASFRNAPAAMRDRQQLLLDQADVVFTGGRSLHEGVLRHRTEGVHLFPSGVDSAHYAGAREVRTRHERPVAGYVGVIDERVDLELVGELARLLPGWTIRMVGPTAKIEDEDLPHAPNIEYPGMVAYADLPEVMAGFDVALMPFALNEATRSISPTKTLEYLAAGLPVLSTRVPDVVRTYPDVVHLADDAAEFADACPRLLDPEDARHRDALAAPLLLECEWDTIAASMAGLLDEVPARVGSLPFDLEDAHHRGVAAASNGLQDAALGGQRLSGDGVDLLADAAVASATPFLRAPLLSRLSDIGRLHPRSGSTCPTCGTSVPCETAEALT